MEKHEQELIYFYYELNAHTDVFLWLQELCSFDFTSSQIKTGLISLLLCDARTTTTTTTPPTTTRCCVRNLHLSTSCGDLDGFEDAAQGLM